MPILIHNTETGQNRLYHEKLSDKIKYILMLIIYSIFHQDEIARHFPSKNIWKTKQDEIGL